MSDTLKDQLLKLGFQSAPPPPRPAKSDARQHSEQKPHGAKPSNAKPGERRHEPRKPDQGKPGQGKPEQRKHEQRKPDQRKPASREDIDLAKAYAIRAQKEKDDRIAEEKRKQEEARIRRENKTKLIELLTRASLNAPEADIARHFPYGEKIRRVYVTQEQLRALNAGELAVVQHGGRYHVVSLENADAAVALYPGCLALKVDPNAPPDDTDYSDPQFQVPDDLVW